MLVCLVGCDPAYVLADTVSTTAETIVVTETVIKTVEVENTDRINELANELQQYKNLVNNLNELLSNVYEVYGKVDNGNWVSGTGFSIEYNNKFYLITAGHVIDNEYGIFKNLGFKVNGSGVYPELIDYSINPDYAIFYSDKINQGFKINVIDSSNMFVLGYGKLNHISNFYGTHIAGESGSPIINISGEVVGITTGLFTDIDIVLDKLK